MKSCRSQHPATFPLFVFPELRCNSDSDTCSATQKTGFLFLKLAGEQLAATLFPRCQYGCAVHPSYPERLHFSSRALLLCYRTYAHASDILQGRASSKTASREPAPFLPSWSGHEWANQIICRPWVNVNFGNTGEFSYD